MTMVDDGAAGAVGALRTPVPSAHFSLGVVIPCVARPGSGLAHLDGPCQCFFGGPPPVFLDAAERILAL